MAVPIAQLKGWTDALGHALDAMDITNSEHLLAAATTAKQRRSLAKECAVSEKVILELANRADLSRIKGVAGVYSDLLEHAGVDTVKELATRVPANLHAKINEVNGTEGLTTKPPSLDDVASWVSQAKELPKTLEY